MNKKDLNRKELLNLLALCIQMADVLPKLKLDFLNHKEEKLVSAINSVNMRDINLIDKCVQENNFNVGNTKDSVVEEILMNVNEISNCDIKPEIKSQALMPSLNRLLHYKLANLENVIQMKLVHEIKNIEKSVSSNNVLKSQILNTIN